MVLAEGSANAKNVYGMKLPKRTHPKKWIGGAVEHPGALREEAEEAGKPTMEFARENAHDSGVTGERSRLALTLRGLAGKKK